MSNRGAWTALVTPQNIEQAIQSTCHKEQPSKLQYITNDVKSFLTSNPACQCTVVSVKFSPASPLQQVIQIRGKLKVTLPQSGQGKLLGFKFLLPKLYPAEAPLAYLDEPENQEVVDFIDYLDQGNRVVFNWLSNWEKQGQNVFTCISTYNLVNLLSEVFKLFSAMPPVSFEELFGSAVNNNPEPQAAPNGDYADEIPAFLLQQEGGGNPVPQRDRQNTLAMIEASMKEQEDNLDNFDPMAELEGINRQLSNKEAGAGGAANIGHSRDTWKMNYKMKNANGRKAEKDQLIQEVIIPKLKENVVKVSVYPRIEDTKELITKIDEYDERSRELDKKLVAVNEQNKVLKDAIPQIDEQIALLKRELANFDKLDVLDSETIQSEIFKPKDEISQEILKQQIKCETMQNTITGFMSIDEIANLKDWLKNIRKASSKQFKAQWKKNKLQQYLKDQAAAQNGGHNMPNQIPNGYPQYPM